MADFFGTPGNDILNGLAGDDTITSYEGIDTIDGGGGDDLIIVGANGRGSGTVEGGAGFDTVQASDYGRTLTIDDSSAEVSVSFRLFIAPYEITGVERIEILHPNTGVIHSLGLIGTAAIDNFDLSSDSTTYDLTIAAGGGNDSITGRDADDIIYGGLGADTINGGGGNDTIYGGAGGDTLNGGDGDDTFNDAGLNDVITGGAGNDTIKIAPFSTDDFEITDFSIDDNISTSFPHVFIGTAAFTGSYDEVRYTKIGGETLIEFDNDGDMVADRTITISNGEFDILYSGNNNSPDGVFTIAPPPINGTSGDDTLLGTSGNDIINGLAGNDTITSFEGIDLIDAGAGDDTIIVGNNDSGSGTIEGGTGFDTVTALVSYSFLSINDSTADVTASFSLGSLGMEYYALTGVERVELIDISDGVTLIGLGLIGSSAVDNFDLSADSSTHALTIAGGGSNDIITGRAAADRLYGGTGVDTIDGGDGNDLIYGGAGADILIGGAGDDTFRDPNNNDIITGGSGSDLFNIFSFAFATNFEITDFSVDDTIETQGNVTFLGQGAFTGIAREVRYEKIGGETLIHIDDDGDMVTDTTITLSNGEFDVLYSGNFADSFFTIATPPINGTSGNDVLFGTPGSDTIYGLAGDDIITSYEGFDTIDGGAGDDIISVGANGDGDGIIEGGTGFDIVRTTDNLSINIEDTAPEVLVSFSFDTYSITSVERIEIFRPFDGALSDVGLIGSSAVDIFDLSADNSTHGLTIAGGGGNDVITGRETRDYLYGGLGSDIINGGGGNDRIYGGDGADILNGGDGADWFRDASGNDVITTGAGNDLISVTSNGVTSFEITDFAYGDELVINDAVSFIGQATFTGATDEVRYAHVNGQTLIEFDTDGDMIANAIFTLSGGEYEVLFNAVGYNGSSSLLTIAMPTITGTSGDDILIGTDANDVMNGFAGDDVLIGLLGADEMDGGDGIDTASYAGSNGAAVNVNLSTGIGTGGAASGDTLTNIENLIGSDFDDTLTGDSIDNTLNGQAGNDVVLGGSGNDNLRGEAGDDILGGGADNDILDGGNGEDVLDGGLGDDTIRGGGGNDSIAGDSGSDSISAGIGNDTVYGGGNNDTILGQGGADTLYGDGGADTLRGGSGNDTLYGGDGADMLFGQGNNDILYGEGGNDTLIGAAGSDQLFGGDGNDILNGSVGADRLDGGAGNDILNGGGADGARDTFVFAEGYDEDRINSFDQAGNDRLELDDALWAGAGTLTAQEVVDMFGSLNATGTILTLDFGNGDILEIQNGAGIDIDTFGLDIMII